MKKSLSLILSLICILTLFSACKQKQNADAVSTEEQTQSSTDLNTNTNTDTESTTSSTEPEQTVPNDQETESDVRNYYQAYHLLSRDLKNPLTVSEAGYAQYIESYAQLQQKIEKNALKSIDESIFSEHRVFLVSIASQEYERDVMGFWGIYEYNGSARINCDIVSTELYEYDIVDKIESSYTDNNYLVLIPREECEFLRINSPGVTVNYVSGGYSKTTVSDVNLGMNEQILVVNTNSELQELLSENGITKSASISESYIALWHYVPTKNPNCIKVSYQKGDFDGSTLEIVRTEYNMNTNYEHLDGPGTLHVVKIPKTNMAQLEDFNIIVTNREITSNTLKVENSDYTDYLPMIEVLYSSNCNLEFLPNEYGTYAYIAKNQEQLRALGKYADSSLFSKYYVLVIYRYEENDTHTVIGYHSFKYDGGVKITVVEEKNKNELNQEYKSISYICVPKTELLLLEETKESDPRMLMLDESVELEKTEITYYDCVFDGGFYDYTSKYRSAYLSISFNAFKSEWGDITPEITEQTFEKNIVLAVRRNKDGRYDEIGYYDLYVDDNEINICLDVELDGNRLPNFDASNYKCYDFIIIPRTIFGNGTSLSLDTVNIHANVILTNYDSLSANELTDAWN